MKKEIILALISKFSVAFASLLFIFVVSSKLTTEHIGAVALLQSVALFVSVVCRCGLDTNLVKNIASIETEKEKYALYASACRFVFILTLITVIIIIIVLNSDLLSSNFSLLSDISLQLCLLLLLISIVNIQAATFNGIHKTAESLFFSTGLPYIVAVVIISLFNIESLAGVAWALILGFFVSVLTAFKNLSVIFNAAFMDFFRNFNQPKLNFHMMIIAICAISIQYLSQILITPYITLTELANFAIALKVSLIATYPLQVVNRVFMPKIAIAHKNREFRNLKRHVDKAQLQLMLFGALFLFCACFFSQYLFLTLNQGFTKASSYLSILLIGQLINLSSGPVVSILLMCGHEKVHKNTTLIISLIFIIALLLVVPEFGAYGAVWVISTTVALKNITAFLIVKFKVYKNDFV